MCDWLTMTTDNEGIMELVANGSLPHVDRTDGKVSRFQNYVGFEDNNGIFTGSAWVMGGRSMKGKRSYAVKVSGADAHEQNWLLGLGAKATRVDAQLTIGSSMVNTRRIASYMDLMGVPNNGVTHDSFSDATLNINKRTSGFYGRVYIKRSESGERFIRYECELKKGAAIRFINTVNEYGYDGACAIHVKKLSMKLPIIDPKSKHVVSGDAEMVRQWNERLLECRKLCDAVCEGEMLDMPARKQVTENTTLKWLEDSVIPCIAKLSESKTCDKERLGRIIDKMSRLYGTSLVSGID